MSSRTCLQITVYGFVSLGPAHGQDYGRAIRGAIENKYLEKSWYTQGEDVLGLNSENGINIENWHHSHVGICIVKRGYVMQWQILYHFIECRIYPESEAIRDTVFEGVSSGYQYFTEKELSVLAKCDRNARVELFFSPKECLALLARLQQKRSEQNVALAFDFQIPCIADLISQFEPGLLRLYWKIFWSAFSTQFIKDRLYLTLFFSKVKRSIHNCYVFINIKHNRKKGCNRSSGADEALLPALCEDQQSFMKRINIQRSCH